MLLNSNGTNMRVGNPSYIEIYDNALNKKECDMIINQVEKSSLIPGHCGTDDYTSGKRCREVANATFEDSSIISNVLYPGLMSCLRKYKDKHRCLDRIGMWSYFKEYNVQKYEGEKDGFFAWHCEHGPHDDESQRILAWMFYLNDAKCGTEFINYPTIKAKRGRCVIWPAFWTHLHRGVVPNKGVKYIATGWVSYIDE